MRFLVSCLATPQRLGALTYLCAIIISSRVGAPLSKKSFQFLLDFYYRHVFPIAGSAVGTLPEANNNADQPPAANEGLMRRWEGCQDILTWKRPMPPESFPLWAGLEVILGGLMAGDQVHPNGTAIKVPKRHFCDYICQQGLCSLVAPLGKSSKHRG